MKKRIFNFSAGPAIMPEEVLLEAQKEFFSYKDAGMSVMEMSHRGKVFDAIIKEAEKDLRTLLNIGDDYAVLFLQGGATLQFSMVPMNLMPPSNNADYIITGAWSKKAAKEAKKVGTVNVAGSTESENFARLPKQEELKLSNEAAYVHFTSNNTIFGTQYKTEPEVGNIPLVCDASSDILHKKIDVNKYGLIYAGAQKNLGPSGLTLVIMKKSLLDRSTDSLHTYLNYKVHAENDSMYNTPPTFAVYIVGLVLKWLMSNGGLESMYQKNLNKANILYDAFDNSNGFYKGTVTNPDDRSIMNVTYTLPNEDLTKKFLAEASEKGFSGLKGHRSVGGIRASIYNAFPTEGVEALVEFMKEFKTKN